MFVSLLQFKENLFWNNRLFKGEQFVIAFQVDTVGSFGIMCSPRQKNRIFTEEIS